MGQKKKRLIRVVLDTNVLISALLFKGELSKMAPLWKAEAFVCLISKETFEEFRLVLGYPKFELSEEEIQFILESEVLPYFEVVPDIRHRSVACKDPDDAKFVACALAGNAEFLVTGDRDLLDSRKFKSLRIVTPMAFLQQLNS